MLRVWNVCVISWNARLEIGLAFALVSCDMSASTYTTSSLLIVLLWSELTIWGAVSSSDEHEQKKKRNGRYNYGRSSES